MMDNKQNSALKKALGSTMDFTVPANQQLLIDAGLIADPNQIYEFTPNSVSSALASTSLVLKSTTVGLWNTTLMGFDAAFVGVNGSFVGSANAFALMSNMFSLLEGSFKIFEFEKAFKLKT
jgi:hypothetical protein